MPMESFWDFSVRTYRTPGVPNACLSLQNSHGADVNMVLYCCWIGTAIGTFEDDLFTRASEYSAHWAKNVVIPLREARTWLKHTGCDSDGVPTASCMELREEIKTVEFATEKMQQEVLESFVSIDRDRKEKPPNIDHICANLLLYLGLLDVEADEDVVGKLSVIITAAFPEIERESVAKAFET